MNRDYSRAWWIAMAIIAACAIGSVFMPAPEPTAVHAK